MISRTHRERERESIAGRLAKLRPAQIVPPHCRPPPPRSHTGQASSFFSFLPQLFFSLLLNVANLAATDHQPTPLHPQTHLIWPSSSIYSDPLFPDLSLFPSVSHSFFLLSPIYYVNVFILIFGCVKCIF